MKIKYLGTAAAEALPALICTCEVCRKSKLAGGKNIRTRSQAIVDDKLLIDFPADTLYHINTFGIDLMDVDDCIITHVHEDHFYPLEIYNYHDAYSHLPDEKHFTVHGSPDIKELLLPVVGDIPERVTIDVREPYKTYTASGIEITPLPANHSTDNPYIYILSDGKKTMLYGNDTGRLFPEVYDYLTKNKVKFDLVSLDCTEGLKDSVPYEGHMCKGFVLETKEKMLSLGLADDNTIFVANHFSHNGFATYDEFVKDFEPENLLVAYDGMEVEF